MRAERNSHTLQTTALVHEAYLRIARKMDPSHPADRLQLLALATCTMKHILVDQSRARRAKKRDATGIAWEGLEGFIESDGFSDLHEALERLAAIDPRQAQIVEMRFFGGCTEDEIALALGISARTVKRDWIVARAWLYGELCS